MFCVIKIETGYSTVISIGLLDFLCVIIMEFHIMLEPLNIDIKIVPTRLLGSSVYIALVSQNSDVAIHFP